MPPAGMASTTVPNLSAFTEAEQRALLAACKAEILKRITGRVQTGSSTGQNFGVELYDTDGLNRLVNALTLSLGLDNEMTFVRPNFTHGTSNDGGGWGNNGVPFA